MTDQQLISQVFDIKGNHSKALGGMVSQAMEAQKAMNSLQGVFSRFNTLVLGGALAFSLDKVKDLNKNLEDTKYRLAGSIGAAGFTTNFADSMLLARNAMKQIREEAAKLPGTDEDFLGAFSMAMPALKEMGMTSLPKMVSLSNNLVAIAKSQGIDSAQAGRDIMQMARGQGGMDVRTFQAIKTSMGVKDQAQWAKMTPEKRQEAFNKAIKAYAPLLDNFENTWEAISSTMASYAKNFTAALTGPAFESAKKALSWMNNVFGQIQSKALLIAEYMGKRLVDAIEGSLGWLGKAVGINTSGHSAAWGNGAQYGPSSAELAQFATAGMFPAATSNAGMFGVGMYSGSSAAPGATQVAQSASLLQRGLDALGPAIGETVRWFNDMWSLVANTVSPLLPPLAYLFDAVMSVLGPLWQGFMAIFRVVTVVLTPVFRLIAETIGFAIRSVADVIKYMGSVMSAGMDYWNKDLKPAFEAFATMMKTLANKIGAWFGVKNAEQDAWVGKGIGYGSTANAIRDEQLRYIAFESEKAKQDAADKARADELAAQAKKGKTNVNITNHFSINQQFATGYEPDRILTAFRDDIKRVAARRLESSISPLFSLGL